MIADADVISRLGELVTRRLDGLARVSLTALAPATAAIPDPGPDLVALLHDHAAEIAAWIDAVAAPTTAAAAATTVAAAGTAADASAWAQRPDRVLRRHLVRWLQQRNQFLQVDPAGARELDALCRAALLDLATLLAAAPARPALADGLRAQLAALLPRLAAFVHARLGAPPRDVVCGNYAPSLQLAILGLADPVAGSTAFADAAADPASTAAPVLLADPILDIGCGADAALVRFLRAAGRDAHGIDRDAPADVANTADWLTHAYGTDRWGTLLSHLGFSLHFLHHHHRAGPAALSYARVYMTILRSLRVGGLFAYAPALPFVEALLPPATYRVDRVPLAAALHTPAVQAAQDATGLPLEHATHVRRLA